MKDFKENESKKIATARISSRDEKMVILLFFHKNNGEVKMECNFPIFHEHMCFVDALDGLPHGQLMEMQRTGDENMGTIFRYQLFPTTVTKEGKLKMSYFDNFLKLLEVLPDLMETYFGED